MTNKLLRSDHFTYHELAKGVWAAIVKTTGLAASNSGIIDLGDRTLIFDTTFSPASAQDLRKTAEKLTGRPVTDVLNSHWHNDHVFGNAIFPSTTKIHATAQTRAIMAEKTEKEIAEFKEHWPRQKQTWAEHAKSASTDAERIDYEEGVQFAQSIIDTFPQVQLRLPDETITDRFEFKGDNRSAKFITFGGGHTPSDAILVLPAERIIFTGDLLVVNNHPDLTDGDPQTWLEILAKIKMLNPLYLIPGHGEIGDAEDIAILERYILELLQMAEQAVTRDDQQAPSFTEGWGNADAFERNMQFLQQKLKK